MKVRKTNVLGEGDVENRYMVRSVLFNACWILDIEKVGRGWEREEDAYCHRPMRRVLEDLEASRTAGLGARRESSTELNCFHIVSCYCIDICKEKDIIRIQLCLNVGEVCVRCLSTIE